MKKNIFDTVTEGTVRMVEQVSDKIAAEFKGSNPYDKEPIKTEDLIKAYRGLSEEEKQAFFQKYGDDAMQLFSEIEDKMYRRAVR